MKNTVTSTKECKIKIALTTSTEGDSKKKSCSQNLQMSYDFLPTLQTMLLNLHLKLGPCDEPVLLWDLSICTTACFKLFLISPGPHSSEIWGLGSLHDHEKQASLQISPKFIRLHFYNISHNSNQKLFGLICGFKPRDLVDKTEILSIKIDQTI